MTWASYQHKKYDGELSEEANIGAICGQTSGNLVVIDLDISDISILDQILPDVLDHTLVTKTGKGYHIYIKVPKLPNTLRMDGILGRIDVQSDGTYVVAPTSVHPNGSIYQIISRTTEIIEVDFQQIICNLEKMGFSVPQSQHSIIEIKRNGTKQGTRNNSMFKVACDLLHKQELDEHIAWSYLQTVNSKNEPPLDEKELRGIFESAKKYLDEKSDSNDALEITKSKIRNLVVSQNNSKEVYAVVEINGHLETVELSSGRAIYWLNHMCQTNNVGGVHGDEFFKNILSVIIAEAQMSDTPREKIYTRAAFVQNTMYYDLGTTDWTFIKMTSDRMEVIPYAENMPMFRRSQSLSRQTATNPGTTDALDQLVKLLRIKDVDVFKVHLVTMFLPHITSPIMSFDGAAGSMKTTTTAAIKRIVDPSGSEVEDNCTAMARNDDLVLQLYNRYMTAFDNVTRIDQNTSDILCRAVTGCSNSKRQLYTNADETILNFRTKIVMNGIVMIPEFPDLQDRMISYDRYPIEENQRLTGKEFHTRLNALLPSVLGCVLTILQKAIQCSVEIHPRTRLADFEAWGEKISQAMGNEPNTFLQKFYEKQRQTSIAARDVHPIVAAIEKMMEDREEYENTTSRCFSELKTVAHSMEIESDSRFVQFPKAPNKLREEITKVMPILGKIGIMVDFSSYTKADGKYTKNSSVITIKKQRPLASPSSLLVF